MISLMFVAAVSLADVEGAVGIDPAMCRVIHFAADGARTETAPRKPYRRPQSVAVRSSSSGGTSSSAVSVSSSSSTSGDGGGRGETRANINGRQISATYDPQGCTVVIDERPAQGARR